MGQVESCWSIRERAKVREAPRSTGCVCVCMCWGGGGGGVKTDHVYIIIVVVRSIVT